MSTAFLILAHDNLPELVDLTAALGSGTFVHLDQPFYRGTRGSDLRMKLDQHANVISDAVCVHWGGFSVFRAMMRLLRAAVESDVSFDHYVFLSGACYPLQPVDAFVRHLETAPWTVHCRAFRLDATDGQMGLERVRRHHHLDGPVGHLRKFRRSWGGPLRKLLVHASPSSALPSHPVYAGSQWTALPDTLAADLVEHYVQGNFDWLRHTFAPDEMAIPTFVHSGPWRDETQRKGPESFVGDTMAALSNFHWLRSDLQGDVTEADVTKALLSDAYFIRKMPNGDEGQKLRRLIRDSWAY